MPKSSFKSIERKAKKVGKSINKGLKKIAKNRENQRKKNNKLVYKALVVLDNAEKRVKAAQSGDDRVEVRVKDNLNFERKREWLESRLDKIKLKPEDVERIKKMARPSYYDSRIEYKIKYSKEDTKVSQITGKEVTSYVSAEKWVTQRQINGMKTREKNGTATHDDLQILSNWQKATSEANATITETEFASDLANMKGVEYVDPVAQARIMGNRRKSLDLSTGGSSQIINDLSYFQSSKYKSEFVNNFVSWIRGAMADKKFFAEVEKYYKSSDCDDVRKMINGAKGKQWYEEYTNVAAALAEFCARLENFYGDEIPNSSEFSDVKSECEAVAAE